MLKIGNRIISKDTPPLVIVELGINHNGNINVAKKLVNSAKKAGAEVIKHQTHIAPMEMSSEAKHAALGGVGIASQGPVGIGADLADAGLYAKEGDWGGAGLSILSLIPVLGMLSGLKKAQRIKKSQRSIIHKKRRNKQLREIFLTQLSLKL